MTVSLIRYSVPYREASLHGPLLFIVYRINDATSSIQHSQLLKFGHQWHKHITNYVTYRMILMPHMMTIPRILFKPFAIATSIYVYTYV